MTQATIDFLPLKKLSKVTLTAHLIIVAIAIAISFVAVVVVIAPDSVKPVIQTISILVSIIATIAAVFVMTAKTAAAKKANELVRLEFTKVNGFQYQASAAVSGGIGTLFEPGHRKVKEQVISGMISNLPFSTYTYKYETGSGKNRRSYDAAVFEVTLPRVVPQFVIDSQLEAVMPIVFDTSQKIELEGDFHKYFDLYAPDTYGVSALTLLAPNTMEVLMEHAALCDIEVVQNKLFFYWPLPADTELQYKEIFTTTQAVLEKLGDKLTRANIYGSKSQATIHAVPNTQGVRLKRSKTGFVIFASVVGYVLLEFLQTTSLAPFSFAVWFIFIGYIFIGPWRSRNLKQEYLARYKRNV